MLTIYIYRKSHIFFEEFHENFFPKTSSLYPTLHFYTQYSLLIPHSSSLYPILPPYAQYSFGGNFTLDVDLFQPSDVIHHW